MEDRDVMERLKEVIGYLRNQVESLSRAQLDMDRELTELREARDRFEVDSDKLGDLEDWKENARSTVNPLLEDMKRYADDLWMRTRDERVPVPSRQEAERFSELLQDWCAKLGVVEDGA